jgi:hypothetical protein
MKPEPSESSEENSLPPRQDPAKDLSANASSEEDLWDLDSPDTKKKPVENPVEPEISTPLPDLIPEPPSSEPATPPTKRIYKKAEPAKKTRKPPVPADAKKTSPRLDDTFDDLDNSDELLIDWEDDEISTPLDDLAPLENPVAAEADPTVEKTVEPVATAPAAEPTPPSLRPRLNLTSLERIGIIAVLFLLIGGGAFFYFQSINRLPNETDQVEARDFPIEGSRITVEEAQNYWRAPITTGPHPDAFRRGTSLLPVLEMEIEGGSGAVRIFFRDDLGEIVGDAISRRIDGAASLKIPATAGFDDIGMHAAYRTGQSKPWTVEVLEGPSVGAPSSEFKRLFKMPLSTYRR